MQVVQSSKQLIRQVLHMRSPQLCLAILCMYQRCQTPLRQEFNSNAWARVSQLKDINQLYHAWVSMRSRPELLKYANLAQ